MAFLELSRLSESKCTVEIKKLSETRSSQENRALHLYFTKVAECLVEVGIDFIYTNVITGDMISIPFTGDLVKNHIWRPLQITMFEIESTTKLTNKMINDILEVMANWLAEKGKVVNFPNRIDLIIEQMEKNGYY